MSKPKFVARPTFGDDEHVQGQDKSVLLRRNPANASTIIVEVMDDYNFFMGYTKTFPDTQEGYDRAKEYFDWIEENIYNLPRKVPEWLKSTLPDADQ